MAYSTEQIAAIGDCIYQTCKEMSVQECLKAQRAVETALEGTPGLSKEQIIDTAVESLKDNAQKNVVMRMMIQSFADPNYLLVELKNNLGKLLDSMAAS